jgi:hypothetical protein
LADSAGKVNILGAGWQVTAIDPQTGATAPHAVVVSIDVAPEYYGDEFALEAALYGPTGELAEVPSPTGTAPLRIGQNVVANKPMIPGQALPNKILWAHSQLVLNFPGGLALAAGAAYTWRVRIDNDDSRGWAATFFVAGPPQGPVIG